MAIVKAYLHSSKESMLEIGDEIGLTGKALVKFRYALYEVEFELEVNTETGLAEIISVNGHKLARE